MPTRSIATLLCCACLASSTVRAQVNDGGAGRYPAEAREMAVFDNPRALFATGDELKEALEVTDGIFMAVGFGNTFLVTTKDGNVVIDTSRSNTAARHQELLRAKSDAPVRYIVLTHGHGDHTGGIGLWHEPGTEIIAQRRYDEFVEYQERLRGFFVLRNAAQYSLPREALRALPPAARPTRTFDDHMTFELGGVEFQLFHTPGETPDHLTVWLPEKRVAFVGDNFYRSFPNMYTLRGTQTRPPRDYIASLDRVLALEPEIVIPSHGLPIHGRDECRRQLTRYRDAIRYVDDAVARGMNEGKDVFTLMREISLPPELDLGESYGRVSWSVRGIYEGYAGWFDLRPATMYDTPASGVYPDMVELAGGPEAVARRAREKLDSGKPVEALHLTDMALAADGANHAALEVRLAVLDRLVGECRNSNERGWLDFAISEARAKLAGSD